MDNIENIDELFSGCLYFSCNKLARVMGKIADEEFRITGLSPNYAFLISIVNKSNGISQKKIGEILHMTPSTITRFIDKLENKDLLMRKTDGKNAYIYLTEKGTLLQQDITMAWHNLYEIYAEILTDEERKEFISTMNKIVNKLEE